MISSFECQSNAHSRTEFPRSIYRIVCVKQLCVYACVYVCFSNFPSNASFLFTLLPFTSLMYFISFHFILFSSLFSVFFVPILNFSIPSMLLLIFVFLLSMRAPRYTHYTAHNWMDISSYTHKHIPPHTIRKWKIRPEKGPKPNESAEPCVAQSESERENGRTGECGAEKREKPKQNTKPNWNSAKQTSKRVYTDKNGKRYTRVCFDAILVLFLLLQLFTVQNSTRTRARTHTHSHALRMFWWYF